MFINLLAIYGFYYLCRNSYRFILRITTALKREIARRREELSRPTIAKEELDE